MIAYLIDPKARTVSEVEHDGTLDSIYRLLECRTIDAVRIVEGDACYVDDESLLRSDEQLAEQGYFQLDTPRGTFAICGRGLIVGRVRGGGADAPPVMPISRVRLIVSWPAHEMAVETAKQMRDTPPRIEFWPDDN